MIIICRAAEADQEPSLGPTKWGKFGKLGSGLESQGSASVNSVFLVKGIYRLPSAEMEMLPWTAWVAVTVDPGVPGVQYTKPCGRLGVKPLCGISTCGY